MSGNHPHQIDDADSERKTQIVVAITLVMMVIEVAYGYITNSVALLADGWHMGTHAAALSITLYAYYYARKKSKKGVERDKVMALGGFVSAIVLAFVALYIGYESYLHYSHPEKIDFVDAIIVACIGLVVNLWCANILGIEHHHHHHDHSHDHDYSHDHEKSEPEKGTWAAAADSYKDDWKSISNKFDNLITNPDDIEDLNRRGAYLHVLADALVSVLVILALLIGMKFPNLVILDPIIGIVAGLVIARWAFGLMVESRNQLLDMD